MNLGAINIFMVTIKDLKQKKSHKKFVLRIFFVLVYIPYPIENSEKRRNLISQEISPFFSPVFLTFDDVSEVSKEGNVW